MHYEEIGEIRTCLRRGRKIVVPGGWNAAVPTYEPTADSISYYAAYYQRTRGATQIRAMAVAAYDLRKAADACSIRKVRESVAYWARGYAARHPAKHAKDGTLVGFDPAKLIEAGAYIPEENTGRKGKQRVYALMAEMANASG